MNETIRQEEVSFIIPGTTTLWEVVRRLGTPDQFIVPGDDDAPSAIEKFTPIQSGQPSPLFLPETGQSASSGSHLERTGKPNKQPSGSQVTAIARYRFVDAKRFQGNFTSWVPLVFPILAAIPVPTNTTLGHNGLGTDEFQIGIDKDWIVRYFAFARDAQNSSFKFWPFDVEDAHPYQLQQIAF